MKFTFATQKIEDAVKKAAQVAKPYARVAGVVVGETVVAAAVLTYKTAETVVDVAYCIGKDAKAAYEEAKPAEPVTVYTDEEKAAAEAEYKRIFGFDLKR